MRGAGQERESGDNWLGIPLPPQEGKDRKERGGEVGASGNLISGKGKLIC